MQLAGHDQYMRTVELEGAIDGEDAVVAADVAERAVGVAWKDHATVAAQELEATDPLGRRAGHRLRRDADDVVVVHGSEIRRAGGGGRPRARHAFFLPHVRWTAVSEDRYLTKQEAV